MHRFARRTFQVKVGRFIPYAQANHMLTPKHRLKTIGINRLFGLATHNFHRSSGDSSPVLTENRPIFVIHDRLSANAYVPLRSLGLDRQIRRTPWITRAATTATTVERPTAETHTHRGHPGVW